MDVVENKNAASGNGLTDVVGPTESDPLSDKGKKPPPKKGLFGIKKGETTPDTDPEDPGPSVSDSENEQEESKKHRRRRQGPRKDVVGIWAHKCRLTPKRGLIYLLFCGAVILLLLFILFLLAALWPRGPSHDPCTSAQCHRYSAKVLGGLNDTVTPCTSFWDYACGGWLKEYPLPRSRAYWDAQAHHELTVKDKLRMLLNTLPSSWIEEPNSVPLKMKRFYDSCMAIDYIDSDGEKGLLRIIKSLGGWNVLRDFRASDFDFPRLLRKVLADHRVFPFFKISVVPDPESPSRNIIRISPSGLSLPHPSYYFVQNGPMTKAFQTFAKDVAQLLGATSYQGGSFAVDMLNFEKRLAEITPDPSNVTDPITSLYKLSVAELKGMSNTIFWGDLLTTLFPQGNINDQTQVITTSVQYLQDVSGLISTTDKGNLNNYLMWHLTQRYLPYLHKQFTEAVETFRRESIGSITGPPRWEFCITETIRFFPHGSDFLLAWNRREERKRTTGSGLGVDPAITIISEMFQHIKQTVTHRVDEAIKYNESVRNYLLDKLRLMSLQVGNPVANKSVLEELYFSVQIQKTDFFPNIVALIEFQGRVAQKDLAHPNKDTTIIINALTQEPFAIQLIPSLNKIVVPQTVLEKEQLYVPDELMSLLYGSVGVELAEAVARSFGPEQGFYLPSGGLLSGRDSKVQEMKDIMDSRRSCLSNFFINIRLDDEDYIERTALDSTLHLAGIQIALESLKTLENSDSFNSLPGIDRPPEALFFLSYGQSQCSVQTMPYHDLEHTTFTSLSHDHKVRGVLRQLVAFTEAFECSKSSEMYADFSCGNII